MPFALEYQRVTLLEQEAVIGTTGAPARRTDIDTRRFAVGMAKQSSGAFCVLGVRVKVRRSGKMTEMVYCHVDAEQVGDYSGDLNGDRSLVFSDSPSG